jgi:hypothetical protein
MAINGISNGFDISILVAGVVGITTTFLYVYEYFLSPP